MPRYSSGSWHVVAAPFSVGIFAAELQGTALEAMWKALHADPSPTAVIENLVGSFGMSLGSLPAFAVAYHHPDSDELRLMVRGLAQARVTTSDGVTQDVSGMGVTSWTERVVPAVVRVELIGDGERMEADAELPLRDGVVVAGRVRWRLSEEETAGSAREPAVEAASAAKGTAVVADSEAEPIVPALSPVPDISVSENLVAADPLGTSLETLAAPLTDTHAPSPAVDPPPAPAAPSGETTTGFEDLLFGATRISTVEDAAVRIEGTEESSAPLAPAPQPVLPIPLPPVDTASASPPVEAVSLDGAAPSGLITGIPFAGASAPSPPVAQPGDHDGETVSAEHLAALRAQMAVQPATPGAGVGSSGPEAVLIVPGGERIALDRGAVVGRRPRAVRATGVIPHLVTIANPNISRSHVELRVEGRDVLATDLNTTNGTRLLRQGAEPVRLHPGEATLLVAGDRLDLGEGIVLEFEEL